jgi:large subunit ribosomal protein L16
MLSPKRTKYRKAHKGRVHGEAKGGTSLNFGNYGLKAVEPGRITARQIEAARRALTRHIKRVGRVRVKPGRIMFELDGVPGPTAREAFDLASAKLPIATRVVTRLGEEAI